MATITLREGDFGANAEVRYGLDHLYLPDPDRPGLSVTLSLADVAEMETIEGDGLGVVKEAVVSGAMGLLLGGPKMMADGFASATKVKDVTFRATLEDGRSFVAVTDFKTYAGLHEAQISARAEARNAAYSPVDPADELIAHYLPFMKPAASEATPDANGLGASAEIAAEPEEPQRFLKPRVQTAPSGFGRRRPTD